MLSIVYYSRTLLIVAGWLLNVILAHQTSVYARHRFDTLTPWRAANDGQKAVNFHCKAQSEGSHAINSMSSHAYLHFVALNDDFDGAETWIHAVCSGDGTGSSRNETHAGLFEESMCCGNQCKGSESLLNQWVCLYAVVLLAVVFYVYWFLLCLLGRRLSSSTATARRVHLKQFHAPLLRCIKTHVTLAYSHSNKKTIALLLSCCISMIHAQQAPFYDTPKFDTTVSHRTNVCERQRQLYADNVTLSEALKGLNLSIVLTNYQAPGDTPFFTLNPDGLIDPENPGLFAIILDELANRAGFQWRNSYGVVLPINSTTDGNKTWTDLLTWEVDTFDIAAGKWDRSIARMASEISFPEGWYDSSMIVVHIDGSSEKPPLNIWSFLLPFQWSVWLLLVATTVVTGVAYWFLERLDATSDDRALEDHPGDAIFYTSIIFTGHFEFRPQTSAAMILAFSTTFIALIVGAVYTANLASFLVARRAPTFNIESVEEAVLLRAPICVQEKVNIDDYLSTKYPEAVLVREPSKDAILTSLKAGECLVAVVPISEYEQFSRYSSVNGDCSLSWSGKVEQIVPSGFASKVDSGVLCSSLVSHVMDLHLIQMKADGFIDREWENHLQRTGDHNCVAEVKSSSSTDDETFSLGAQEMAGIFIIHTILLAIAIVVALFQYHRVHRQRLRASQRHLVEVRGSKGHNDDDGNVGTRAASQRGDEMVVIANQDTKGHFHDNGVDNVGLAMDSKDSSCDTRGIMSA